MLTLAEPKASAFGLLVDSSRRLGRTSFFSVHVPSTGPICKTPPNSTRKGSGLRLRTNQPRPADIGPIVLTAKDNLPHC